MTPLSPELRALLNVGTTRDAATAGSVLAKAGIDACVCDGMTQLVSELHRGAGALLLAEETLVGPALALLVRALAEQQPWSDVPLLVVALRGADSVAIEKMVARLPGATVIERPVRIASLVSAVRAALRARQRQYELRSRMASLREADQRKTEFLATLAHELRNPLAPLSNSLALLSHAELPAEDVARCHEMMRRQVDHMARLVADLMDVSRITRGKVELQRVTLPLADAIDGALELSRPWMEAAGHRLSVQRPRVPLYVRGDRVRLTQVFANLLNNAAKYTPPGGHVEVLVGADRGEAVIEVRDDGAGLAPDMLQPIFEMFVQVAGSAKIAQGGLGIGLTLVKSLVDLHGGSVIAESGGLDRGATFRVRLPLAQAPAQQDESAPAAAKPGAAMLAGNVLVVDDNHDVADSLAALLRALGSRVFVAYDAQTALRLASALPIESAVLDIGMPELDGCELARRLRALPDSAHMTLVALTGWGQQQDRQRVREAGFDHHLLKPVEPKQLVRALTTARPLERETGWDPVTTRSAPKKNSS